jgi:AcrR family transcriptional regulator
MTVPVRAAKPRNAEASRKALLRAASELFSEQGYEQSTVREIGERAGVDPALIARYYGNKLALYLATLTADGNNTGISTDNPSIRTYVERLLEQVERHGPGPLLQAIVRTDTSPEIREVTRLHLEQRLVAPLTDLFTRKKVPSPQLKAEAAVAMLTGILIVRTANSLGQLHATPRAELADLLTSLIESLGAV